MNDKQLIFLIEAYKLAVNYFSGYADRIYNRFNIFLGIEIALSAIYASAWFQTKGTSIGEQLILMLGIIISLLLYIQSAQDNFVTKRHRERINNIRELIEKKVKLKNTPALFSPLDETDIYKRLIFEDVTSWRAQFISVSRVRVITSLVFVFFWVTAISIKS